MKAGLHYSSNHLPSQEVEDLEIIEKQSIHTQWQLLSDREIPLQKGMECDAS